MLLANVKHEARLIGSARSLQDMGWNCGESLELRSGQPLLFERLFHLVYYWDLAMRSAPDPINIAPPAWFIRSTVFAPLMMDLVLAAAIA